MYDSQGTNGLTNENDTSMGFPGIAISVDKIMRRWWTELHPSYQDSQFFMWDCLLRSQQMTFK
jgi:hypothetical protein